MQYFAVLEEWKTGHFVSKKFEAEKYSDHYVEIYNYILEHVENDPLGENAADRFASWASDRYVGPLFSKPTDING